MTEPGPDATIRRILVALDASPQSLAALRTAVELADLLHAELVGLYIEDIQLLRVAGMPFAREHSLFQAAPHPITRVQVERQLRTQARQARRALEAAAQPRHLTWSFKVLQGMISVELLAAAKDTDVVILGKSGWSRRRRLGSTARVIIQQSPHQAIILGQGAHIGLPVGVLYDGSDMAHQTLRTALQILQQREGYLVVIILAPTHAEARRVQAEAAPQLRQPGLHVHYRWLVNLEADLLHAVVQSERLGVMLIPGEPELIQDAALLDLFDRAAFPIWIVR